MLFDVKKYEVPSADQIDIEKTTYNVGVFLKTYKSARNRVGEPSEPKTTTTFSLVPPTFSNQFNSTVENIVISNEEAIEEFNHLHNLFKRGMAGIEHPFKPDVTIRRKKIFFNRYVKGESIEAISYQVNHHRNVVSEESIEALVQFANALELTIKK